VLAYILGHILQNIGLQGHIHINSTGHPAQLSLSYIEDAIDLSRLLPANLDIFPGGASDLFDGRLDFAES